MALPITSITHKKNTHTQQQVLHLFLFFFVGTCRFFPHLRENPCVAQKRAAAAASLLATRSGLPEGSLRPSYKYKKPVFLILFYSHAVPSAFPLFWYNVSRERRKLFTAFFSYFFKIENNKKTHTKNNLLWILLSLQKQARVRRVLAV